MKDALIVRVNRLAWSALEKIDEPVTNKVVGTASSTRGTLTMTLSPNGPHESGSDGQLTTEKLTKFLFSPLEINILKTIGTDSVKGSQIGKRLSMVDASGQPTVTIRVILKNLVQKNVLEHDEDGAGYRISTIFAPIVRQLGFSVQPE